MNDEIKEILDRLERIDHKEYSCGFEFADSSTFDEMARCFKERKKMADYIINLQQENERLNKDNKILKQNNINEVLRNDFDMCVKDLKKANKKIEKLEDYKLRIEKATNKVQYIIDIGFDYDGYNDVDNLKILVDELVDLARQTKNILNGSDE